MQMPPLHRSEEQGHIRAVCQMELYLCQLPNSPWQPTLPPAPPQHAQPMLKNNSSPGTYQPCCVHHCVPPTPLCCRGAPVYTEQTHLGTDFFSRRMGCHGDKVLCITFHPCCSHGWQQVTATQTGPTLLTQEHCKLHQPLSKYLNHSLPRQLSPSGQQTFSSAAPQRGKQPPSISDGNNCMFPSECVTT